VLTVSQFLTGTHGGSPEFPILYPIVMTLDELSMFDASAPPVPIMTRAAGIRNFFIIIEVFG